jgi:hypothetical protein
MPTLPLHPAIVHVPLGLAFVLPFLTLGLTFAMWRGVVPHRAWVIAVALQATVVAAGGVARWAGERDEKRVERIVGDPAIEAHEHAAEAFLWGASIVLVVAATVLILPSRAAIGIAAATAVGTLVVAALAYDTGKAGGELVYARGGAAAFAAGAGPPPSRDALLVREKHDD